jgi:hypothetical protein
MKLGIIGAIALALGVWALASWWWFVAEIIEALIAIGLVVGGGLAIAISVRRLYRAKQAE